MNTIFILEKIINKNIDMIIPQSIFLIFYFLVQIYFIHSSKSLFYFVYTRYRSKLLWTSQKLAAIQQWSPDVGHYGLVCVWLSHGQYGPSSLRNVHPVRKRLISYSPRPRSGVWQGVPRRDEYIGSNHTVLSYTKVYTGNFAEVPIGCSYYVN